MAVKTPRNPPLTRERIVDAAYDLAREDPLNALSMRRIAKALKVTPMAIYKHFTDKADLTAAVMDKQMLESRLIPEQISPDDWRNWIRTSYLRMWDTYASVPNMIPYMTHATRFGPAVLHWQNEALGVMIGAGLEPRQAVTTLVTLSELAVGNTILRPMREQGLEQAFPGVWQALASATVPAPEALHAAENIVADYPWLLHCGQAMVQDLKDPRQAFVGAMDLILTGVENLIAGNKKASQAPAGSSSGHI
ncbi:MAG: TetR/AcrR family transcriptional regulator [Pseudomonadota bacterium]|nr:hypothetical protein [Pseudomonadales bacterium]MDY6921157.1 TetR/AcrR family transcriptional regulator [Pseudomonadota bacterium]